MKRLILSILAFLLLAAPVMACDWINTFDGKCSGGEPAQLARMNPAVLGAGVASCTPSSPGDNQDEVGNINAETVLFALYANRFYCQLFTADCSGSLGTAYAYSSTTGLKVKIAAYSTTDTDSESVPTNGSLLGSTAEIVSDSNDDKWYSSAMSGGIVTASAKYWICYLTPNANVWAALYGNGLSRHYINFTGTEYATPPASLPTTGWTAVPNRKTSIFIGIE